MTAKLRIPLADAEALATEVLELLRPACERLQVAGSIRRQRPDIGDLELVAIPRYELRDRSRVSDAEELGLFDDLEPATAPRPLVAVNLLDERCEELLDGDAVTPRLDRNGRPALGSRYQRLLYRDFGLDLFITTPAQFGVIFTLRTGPADYSHRLVTSTRQGGLLPAWLQVKDGALHHRSTGEIIPTPEETDFFEAIGLPWLPPEARR